MKKTFPTLFFLLFLQNINAQFGTTPQVLTRSTNSNQIQMQAADLDADGDPDVLCTHNYSLIWYENVDGKANFSNDHELMPLAITNSGGNYQTFFTDLNADGLPDLVAGRFWRKNLGGGNFAPAVTVFAANLQILLDVNGDNLPDAIHSSDNAKIYWQRNLGNEKFAANVTLASVSNFFAFTAADLNLDGKQDFIAQQTGGFYFYKNLGNSTFSATQISAGTANRAIAEDFNADGKMDVIAAIGASIVWYEFDSTGNFTLRQTISTQNQGGALALGELDADGDKDIFAGAIGTTSSKRAKYFAFDAATGLFDTAPKNHNNSLITHSLAQIVDLNGDAQPDLLTSVGTISQAWQQNLAPGSFSSAKSFNRLLALPKEIEIADLENDGDMDIFAVGELLENLGGGNYAEKRRSAVTAFKKPFRGDLDGDGLKDLARPLGDSVAWQKNLGNNNFSPAKLIPGLVTSCKQVGGGDLDNDGDLDLFACNGTDAVSVNARFYWFENDGKGNFTDHLIETDIQFCSGAAVLDPNGDGLPDLFLTFFNGNDSRLYENLGGGNFQWKALFSSSLPNPIAVNQSMLFDLDGDGRLDYLFSDKTTTLTTVAWYRNLGAAGFSEEKVLATMSHQGSYATPFFTVFDATLDGLPDVVVSDNYWNRFLLVRGLGNSTFSAASTIYDGPDFGDFFGVAPHDVDGDGRLDIVFGNRTDALGNLNGYNQISWLANLTPAPVVPFSVIEKSMTCSDNQTPAVATDDILTISLKIKGFDNSSTQFILSDFSTGAVVDTFFYDKNIVFSLPPGSADGAAKNFKIKDLLFQDTFLVVSFAANNPCSAAAPAVILISNIKISCHDNGTPDEPTDDKLIFWLTPKIYNPVQPSSNYLVSSNFGFVLDTTTFAGIGKYGQETYFELLPGSAAADGKLVLSLQDFGNFGFVEQFVFDNPGTCSSVALPCPVSVFYHKQSEIDSFPIKFPGCRVLAGDLILEELLPGAGVPSIENLLGFRQILEVRGDVNIFRARLKNLVGLDSLRLVGRDLNVLFFNSPELESLAGLGGLQKIGRDIWFSDTAATLKNLTGVENLDTVGRDFLLWQMASVKNFEGLENLKSAGIWTYNCAALENLKGLENLESAYSISLAENPNLKSLDGLQNLKTIAGDTFSMLQIARNPLLNDLSALDHAVSIPALEIWENPKLNVCAVEAICNYLKNFDPAKTEIVDNLTDCNSVAEVQNSCTVSAADFSQLVGFQVTPNPISDGELLQISLENDFFGTVKFEILSLDGRVLNSFFEEKTSHRMTLSHPMTGLAAPFIVRVSDGKTSAARLVFEF